MQIRAAVFRGPGTPFEVRTVDLDPPTAGEVLVRIKAVGVCHSDWHLMTGATKHPLPAVAGHEGSGIVEAVGRGTSTVQPGQQVSLNWAPSCGECYYCTHERPNLCAAYFEPIWAGTMIDGTTRLSMDGLPLYHYCALGCFAEYAVVAEQCCIPIQSEVPFNVAALIGCAVTTGVGSVLNTAKVKEGSSVAVFGVGGVGLSTVMGARLAGASQVIAVDPLRKRLDAALELGATAVVLAGPEAMSTIRRSTEGRGADYVFEAVGIPSVQEECLEAVRPGGTVVFSGISPMGSVTNLSGAVIVRHEKTIMGSYYGTADPKRDFPKYAELYLQGALPLDKLVSKTYALAQINKAYADMLSGETARGVIVL